MLLIGSLGFSQEKDSTMQFYGNLYDPDNYHPIEYAHIINIDGNNATISDSLGTFNLEIEPGDSLMITSVGYQTHYYQYDGPWQKVVFKSIPMEEQVYAISEVRVTPWGTYREFRQKFLDLEMKTDAEKVHPLLWKDINREPKMKEEPLNPGIMSPITMIYNIFNDEIQSRRKLRQLQRRKPKEKILQDKFNREQVGALTGLEGKKLERFMEFCNFSEEYLLNTKEYFILERVKLRYEQFMRLDSLHQMPMKQ